MDNRITKPHLRLPLEARITFCMFTLGRILFFRRDGTFNRRIINFFDIKAPAAPSTRHINPTTTVSAIDVTVDESRNLWFRLFVPNISTSDQSMPLVVYFHGGGFSMYGPDSKQYDNHCSNLAAKAHAVVASVNYRLAPEYKYPCQYDDGLDTLKFIDQQNFTILPSNTDITKCFVAGDSAGANIAHHVTLRFCKQKSNEFENLKIVGLLGIQPFFGGQERVESELRDLPSGIGWLNFKLTDWMWKTFLPEGADRNHPAAYVFGSAEEMKRVEFPRSLIIVGGYDPLLDWQKMYAKWLRDSEKKVELIEYPNAFHCFFWFPKVAEHDFLIDDAVKFIQE